MSLPPAVQRAASLAEDLLGTEQVEQFRMNAADFLSPRSAGESAGTRIEQMSTPLDDAAETVNRSFAQRGQGGTFTNVISPVVIPRDPRSTVWMFVAGALVIFGIMGAAAAWVFDSVVAFLIGTSSLSVVLFGPHYWVLLLAFIGYNLWRNSFVMVPDGCQALITRFGKLERVVSSGRTSIIDPFKKVSYIVNTTREYPYNAPIREAPTAGQVNASVDLFLQFKIEDPAAFIFTLGGARGFQEKLQNAVSEVTRALIYDQRASEIYNLVGESTQSLLDTLNQQFLPAVRFVNANITHAEPSSQEYRMDLAAPEMIRVAKEAYTYQYELQVRKEQDEGDLNRELAGLHEQLSAIRAEIATYQAQIDTAREKEIYRANAYASQLMSEAQSAARANAALLEAQALDIRAVSAAAFPEILQYRYQRDILDRLEAVAGHLPQIVQAGGEEQTIDFLETARRMVGVSDEPLFGPEEVRAISGRLDEIKARIRARNAQLSRLVAEDVPAAAAAAPSAAAAPPVAPVQTPSS
ncbi:SPFH domain-containing protein [Candidatus Viridilinea mediisalina]|uniref:Band 7 protein n=1 Tax=Candidatus Viridilinea mediisalina TaxID=2024553 RepID=A0A2A6RMI8_9CHLR|nr:SPFH domain-containing protein [Candidatus Viridilinea mediisalina]PDW04153.1 Band 7 protein [Candidatus Viridilinea mediisalina]